MLTAGHGSHAPTHARVTVMQGQSRVSGAPDAVLSTVLGSCVATCLYDPEARIGGMNHFLLPEPHGGGHGSGPVDEHYGIYLMEVLINEMLAKGARKPRLRAHLYGGANMHKGMARIGSMNAAFARAFLDREGIVLARENLGGTAARRVEFRPASGQVRCRLVENAMAPDPLPLRPRPDATGDLELF